MSGRGLSDSVCLADENQGPRVRATWLIKSILGRDRLRNVAIVVIKHPAEPLTTFHFATVLANFSARIDERVFQALVISLGVIMSEIFMNCVAHRFFTEKYKSVQTLGF